MVDFIYPGSHTVRREARVEAPSDWTGPTTLPLLTRVWGPPFYVFALLPVVERGDADPDALRLVIVYDASTAPGPDEASYIIPPGWFTGSAPITWESAPPKAIVVEPPTLVADRQLGYAMRFDVRIRRPGTLSIRLPLPMRELARAFRERAPEEMELVITETERQEGELLVLPPLVAENADKAPVTDGWPADDVVDIQRRLDALAGARAAEPPDAADDISVVAERRRHVLAEHEKQQEENEEDEGSVEPMEVERPLALDRADELLGGAIAEWACPVMRDLLRRALPKLGSVDPPASPRAFSDASCPVARRGNEGARGRMYTFPELYTLGMKKDKRRRAMQALQTRVYRLKEPINVADLVDEMPVFTALYLLAEAFYYLLAHAAYDELEELGELEPTLYAGFLRVNVFLDVERHKNPPMEYEPALLKPGVQLPLGSPPSDIYLWGERLRTLDTAAARVQGKRPTRLQLVAVLWMLGREYGFLGLRQGMGKTLTAILYTMARGGRTVVMASNEIAGQWQQEAELQRLGHLLITAATARAATESKVADAGLILTTPTFVANAEAVANASDDRLRVHRQLAGARGLSLIVDEAHAQIPKESKAVLLPAAATGARFLLSGTPFINVDLRSEAGRFYNVGFNRAGAIPQRSDFFLAEYDELTLPNVRPGAIKDLPPFAFQLSNPREGALYHALSLVRGTAKHGGDLHPSSSLFALCPRFVPQSDFDDLQARYVESGPPSEYWALLPRQDVLALLSPKYDWARLCALHAVFLERATHPVVDPAFHRHVFLLFSTRIGFREGEAAAADWPEYLKTRLAEMGVGMDLLVMAPGKKEKTLAEFKRAARANESRPLVLFGTYASMATGLNLQDADTVVLLDLPWQPTQYDQARFRALRTGQKPGRVWIYTITADGTEEVARAIRGDVKRMLSSTFANEGEIADVEPADLTFGMRERERLWAAYRALPVVKAALDSAHVTRDDVNFANVVIGV
jgi:hypothetical protein